MEYIKHIKFNVYRIIQPVSILCVISDVFPTEIHCAILGANLGSIYSAMLGAIMDVFLEAILGVIWDTILDVSWDAKFMALF